MTKKIGWYNIDQCPNCRGRDRYWFLDVTYPKEEHDRVKDFLESNDDDGGVRIPFYLCACGLCYAGKYIDDPDRWYREHYTMVQSLGHRDKDSNVPSNWLADHQDENEKFRAERVAKELVFADGYDILDIGCARGYLLKELEKAGASKVVGVDLRPDLALEGLEVYGSLEELPQQFNVITMIHMLEHILDPVSYLMDLEKHLTPGGIIFIEVPAFAAAQNAGTLSINHPLAFTTLSLRDTVLKAGYMPENISQMIVRRPGELGPSMILQVIARGRL